MVEYRSMNKLNSSQINRTVPTVSQAEKQRMEWEKNNKILTDISNIICIPLESIPDYCSFSSTVATRLY